MHFYERLGRDGTLFVGCLITASNQCVARRAGTDLWHKIVFGYCETAIRLRSLRKIEYNPIQILRHEHFGSMNGSLETAVDEKFLIQLTFYVFGSGFSAAFSKGTVEARRLVVNGGCMRRHLLV